MDDYEEKDLLAIYLVPVNEDIDTEVILLRNFTVRKNIHEKFIEGCERKDKDTEWSCEKLEH